MVLPKKILPSHRSRKMTIVHLYIPEIDFPFDNGCNFRQKIGNSTCRFPEGNVPKSSLVFFFNFNRGLHVNVFIRLLLGWLRQSRIAHLYQALIRHNRATHVLSQRSIFHLTTNAIFSRKIGNSICRFPEGKCSKI